MLPLTWSLLTAFSKLEKLSWAFKTFCLNSLLKIRFLLVFKILVSKYLVSMVNLPLASLGLKQDLQTTLFLDHTRDRLTS